MKKGLLISIAILLLTSCSKDLVVPDRLSVSGTWVLAEAARSNGYGWQYFNTGLENGIFDFYHDGAAEYSDGYHFMRGIWTIRTVVGGYYDQYGNYYHDAHETFEVHVYDAHTRGSVDLYFDEVVIYSNRMVATNYNGSYISRYVFRR